MRICLVSLAILIAVTSAVPIYGCTVSLNATLDPDGQTIRGFAQIGTSDCYVRATGVAIVEVGASGQEATVVHANCDFPVYTETCRTADFALNVSCRPEGSVTLKAIGYCAMQDGSVCRSENAAPVSTTFVLDDPASVHIIETGPDASGLFTGTVEWNFPSSTSGTFEEWLELPNGGVSHNSSSFGQQTGTRSWQTPTSCWPAGDYKYRVRLTGCTGTVAEDEVTLTVLSHEPTVNVTVDDSNPADVIAEVSWSFAHIDPASAGHSVWLDWADGGHVWNSGPAIPLEGSSGPIHLGGCSLDQRIVVAGALACDDWGDGYAEDRASIHLDIGVDVSVFMYDEADVVKARVDWTFLSQIGVIKVVQVEPSGAAFILDEFTPTTSNGSRVYVIPAGGEVRTVRVEATGTIEANCRYDFDAASHPCGCSRDEQRTVGDPVDVVNGNMRYSDGDSIASGGELSLSRVYDSRHALVGRFGIGWTSLFDAVAQPNLPASVMIVTDSNTPVVFQARGAVNGTYFQKWPRSDSPAELSFTSGMYAYRPAGGTREWMFDATTGRLMKIRMLSNNRAVLFAYDTSGNPIAVTDSWGAWSWTITTSAGRITSISVDGQSGMTWTYQYDTEGHLTDVLAPGSLQWRQYSYSTGKLSNAYDGAGNLIESHDYDAQGRAITSHGPSDEITSIEYEASGTTATERVTRVNRASGAVLEYRSQLSGGTWRPSVIQGNCLSCGTSADATNVYDTYGLVTRVQNAAGYVTTHSYDGLHRRIASTGPLKPAGCDPETDSARCRVDSPTLATATLENTNATLTTTFTYDDANWPEKPTLTQTPSVVASGQMRNTVTTYHATSGAILSVTNRGYTSPNAVVTHVTTNEYYGDGIDPLAPAFDPGGTFQSSWLLLPQPLGALRAIDGPRNDVTDVTAWVHYPVDASVPAFLRGRLAAVRNRLGR